MAAAHTDEILVEIEFFVEDLLLPPCPGAVLRPTCELLCTRRGADPHDAYVEVALARAVPHGNHVGRCSADGAWWYWQPASRLWWRTQRMQKCHGVVSTQLMVKVHGQQIMPSLQNNAP